MIVFNQDVVYVCVSVYGGVGCGCCCCYCLGDCVYFVECVVLGVFDVVVLFEGVMQQDVSGVWCMGIGIVVDDVVEIEQCFDWFVFKLVVQVFGGGNGEQVQQFLVQGW